MPFVAFLLVLVLTSAARVSHAQPRGGPVSHSPAAPDTGAFFPLWMHPWLEIGGDWLTAPRFMKHGYESGQAFGLGLSVQPRKRLELRTAFDFQTLQTSRTSNVAFAYDYGGVTYVDTLSYSMAGRAWSWTLRPEIGISPLHDVWITGGAGGGYMNAGLDDILAGIDEPSSARVPEAMHNGWGWLWTAAVRYDVQPDPMIPLGLDVRTTSMKRGPDFVRTWSVRLTYRVPESARRGGGGPRR